ncbi:MAG: PAS domain-containing protein [Roseitalea sp.]|jgi:hypothetical protein|nr:PAS domain-containing protein [Roseitalea sp.]MBO6741351.1 PAS domain-containing protein [Roseitalea sp.]
MDQSLQFSVMDGPRPLQETEDVTIASAAFLEMMSQFEPFGLWRMELETGLVYWTRDIYEIHEIPHRDGPVNVKMAIDAYHPDDRDLVVDCLEDVVARKSGFHFVLRIVTSNGRHKMVKAVGKFHVGEDGREELIGSFSEDPGGVRGVVIKQ